MGLILTCGLCRREMEFGDFSHKKGGLVVCEKCSETKSENDAKLFLQSVMFLGKPNNNH